MEIYDQWTNQITGMIICTVCEKSEAKTYCIAPKCQEDYCENCFAFTHQTPTKKAHFTISIEFKSDHICSTHKTPFRCICLTCDCMTCIHCCLKNGDHCDHNISTSMSGASVKSMIENDINKARSWYLHRKSQISSWEETKCKCDEKLNDLMIQRLTIKQLLGSDSSYIGNLSRKSFLLSFAEQTGQNWKLCQTIQMKLDGKSQSLHISTPKIEIFETSCLRPSDRAPARSFDPKRGKSSWIGNLMDDIVTEYSMIASTNDPGLVEIILADCKLNDENVAMICQSLLRNTNVIKLDLSNNREIVGRSVQEICQLIERTCILQEMFFSGCPIEEQGIQAMKKSLRSNRSLVQVHFGSNQTEEDFQDLERLLQANFDQFASEICEKNCE